MGKSKSKSTGTGTGATETTGEAKRRAMAITGRLARFAVAGFPPLEQLKVRVAQFYARVDKKLGAVPRQRQTFPPATIVAPAAFQYALLGESDEVADLREMFENLLMSSMDRDTSAGAHPAFVSMISQLTPDEARILKSINIDRTDYGLITAQMSGKTTDEALGFRTRVGIGTGIDEARQLQYISNLERLGILRISDDPIANREGFREYGLLHGAIKSEFPGRHLRILNGSIQVTPLGRQFLITCVCARAR